MTNQKYIEEIIRIGIDAGYNAIEDSGNIYKILLDPNFFRAIGKVKKWHKKYLDLFIGTPTEKDLEKVYKIEAGHKMHTFIDKIIEKDLDHAIEWLYNLIKE